MINEASADTRFCTKCDRPVDYAHQTLCPGCKKQAEADTKKGDKRDG